MPTSFSALIIALLASLMAMTACTTTSSETEAKSLKPLLSSDSHITLQVIKLEPLEQAKLRLTNGSSHSIAWTGYPDAPWYRIRRRNLLTWQEEKTGFFCAVGLTPRTLPPGESIEFKASLGGRDIRRVQIGQSYLSLPDGTTRTCWSPSFSPR